jgi:hypothetical protein
MIALMKLGAGVKSTLDMGGILLFATHQGHEISKIEAIIESAMGIARGLASLTGHAGI